MTAEDALVFFNERLKNSGLTGALDSEDGAAVVRIRRPEGKQVGSIVLNNQVLEGSPEYVRAQLTGAIATALKAIVKEPGFK